LTCILVGNKVDLCTDDPTRRQVLTNDAEEWAQEEGLLFVEASAKSGQNVESAFEQACRDILRKIGEGVFDDDRVRALCPRAPRSAGLTSSSHLLFTLRSISRDAGIPLILLRAPPFHALIIDLWITAWWRGTSGC